MLVVRPGLSFSPLRVAAAIDVPAILTWRFLNFGRSSRKECNGLISQGKKDRHPNVPHITKNGCRHTHTHTRAQIF